MRTIRTAIALLMLTLTTPAAVAQDISQIGKSDPLIITGAIGTRNTYYHSSAGNSFASPMSNQFFANMNVSFYGITMPFSFFYSNDNNDFNFPHFSFKVNPHYRNWQLMFGQSTMGFSPYVMNMPFNGVGVEYQGSKLRYGMFYGSLRNAVNDNPQDPEARQPQYKRMAWGMKLGYGTQRNYLDVYFLRAYDQLKSLSEGWRNTLSAQDNFVVGVRGSVALQKHLSLTANFATSVFSTDKTATKMTDDDVNMGGFDKVFDARYTSMSRYAGDVSLNLSLSGLNTSLFYRIIEPDYTSLGTYYMSNNYQSVGVSLGTALFKKISLTASFSAQEDNLSDQQLYTTRGFVYSVNTATQLGQNFALNLGYNGYRQTQGDGTAHVNDTVKVDRVMHSVVLAPSYVIPGENVDHTISLSGSYTQNKDLNRFATGESDVETYAVGASYNIGVEPWNMDFTTTMSHQQSDGYHTRYTSDVLSLTTGRAFHFGAPQVQGKEDDGHNMNVELTVSMCYNQMKDQMKNLSVGAEMQVGYSFNKVHVLALSAGLSKYGDVNISNRRSGLDDTEFTASLNYTYTFSLVEMKRKAEKQKQ